jgi:two-component system phosphate regulon response regulator PhoB
MARILIVNDEEDLLVLCKQTLEESGHTVEMIMSGTGAIELGRQLRPDLLILDWVVPDMDGHAVLAMWRSVPELSGIPVLAISALQDGAALAKRAGADDFLQKPFGADDLVDAANQVLARVRPRGLEDTANE